MTADLPGDGRSAAPGALPADAGAPKVQSRAAACRAGLGWAKQDPNGQCLPPLFAASPGTALGRGGGTGAALGRVPGARWLSLAQPRGWSHSGVTGSEDALGIFSQSPGPHRHPREPLAARFCTQGPSPVLLLDAAVPRHPGNSCQAWVPHGLGLMAMGSPSNPQHLRPSRCAWARMPLPKLCRAKGR